MGCPGGCPIFPLPQAPPLPLAIWTSLQPMNTGPVNAPTTLVAFGPIGRVVLGGRFDVDRVALWDRWAWTLFVCEWSFPRGRRPCIQVVGFPYAGVVVGHIWQSRRSCLRAFPSSVASTSGTLSKLCLATRERICS